MSNYDYAPDPSWRLPEGEVPADGRTVPRKGTRWERASDRMPPPATFRESFRTLPEPFRSTFLRVGAAMLDLDDPAVFENACRLADSVGGKP